MSNEFDVIELMWHRFLASLLCNFKKVMGDLMCTHCEEYLGLCMQAKTQKHMFKIKLNHM
jgi:hypothetical protein